MQKAFYSDDLMEFKINHKWQNGILKDILIEQNKYILCLWKTEEKLELQNPILLINNFSYSPNEKVEFFDESSNSWTEGTIKTKNNNFYLITFTTITSLNNSRILYKDIEEILSKQKTLDDEFKTKKKDLRKNLAKLQAELSVLTQDKELIDKKIT